jgi:acrylyl-CoA reductase (NADPH)
VARTPRLVPGVDLAGEFVESSVDDIRPGAAVIAHGYGIGVERHGGFAEYARVPAEWVVPLPGVMTARAAMIVGTAGFTAALSIDALERHGLSPEAGPVLVLGATGGVGSVAVALLAHRGYEVWASTGKAAEADYLRALGAHSVLDRMETSAESRRPLESQRWAAAIDPVGGASLAYVLRTLRYGGAVATSGLTGGARLETTVLPFILRSVSLLGIDSVAVPIEQRRELWDRLADDLRSIDVEAMAREVDLDALEPTLDAILAGDVRGRTIVRLAG